MGHGRVLGNQADYATRELQWRLTQHISAHFQVMNVILQWKNAIWNKCNIEWSNVPLRNKLWNINEEPTPWGSSNNWSLQTEIILCWLRIGLTRLMHRYQMEAAPPPFCLDCLVLLKTTLVLEKCPTFMERQITHFHWAQLIHSGWCLPNFFGSNLVWYHFLDTSDNKISWLKF